MEAVTPAPAVGAPFVSNGDQTEVQLPVQALTAAPLLVPGVSLVKTYNVQPEALTRMEPRDAFWLTLTAAGEVGVAMGAIVADATGAAVVTGVSVDCPVIGITGAAVAVLTGMAVAAGVAAEAHAESTRVTMRRVEKKILLFMTILLEVIMRLLLAS